jgi:hypothetical protein
MHNSPANRIRLRAYLLSSWNQPVVIHSFATFRAFATMHECYPDQKRYNLIRPKTGVGGGLVFRTGLG